MKLRRIVMVEPRTTSKNVFSYIRLPRLGLPILGTLAARAGLEVQIYLEQSTAVDPAALAAADLVCLSTITSTAPAAYQLADQARAAGVPVVVGGPHVNFLPEEALAHADWVLRGEAERAFPLFLQMLRSDGDPAAVPGLSWIQAGQVRHSPLAPQPADLDQDVPIPDFSLLVGHQGRWFDRGVIPIQTSRGCPHHCRFCSVTPMFGRRMRHASEERVAEELEQRRGQGSQVFFYDDNFCEPTSRSKRLLDHLLTRDVFLPAPLAQVSVRAAEDLELLGLMRRARFDTVFVGFESIHPEALALYRKRQQIDDIRQTVSRFHRFGIKVHGMFVAGSDAEGVETIRNTARFAREEGIDSVQFLVLTPLPGTELFEEYDRQDRLLTRDWSLYDTHHAVFQPARMSSYALMTETFEAMARFYSYPRSFGLLLRGRVRLGAISLYARAQVRRWFRENRELLAWARQTPRFLRPWPGAATGGA